ncbi:unnamed protein product [Ectocarpus sp. CCAP 1310/34]|nr:unnamed protein product [Ectocarpus sp. CCAP 1310/34]
MIEVACKVARDFQWEPPEELGVSVTLFALDAQRYNVGASDLPVWGEYIVSDSLEEAYASIKPDDDAENLQYVRLLHVADTQLLRRMCKEAEESVVSEDAGLYLRVAKSCPAFYALWDESEDNAGTHEVRNRCARTDSTSNLVAKFRGTGSTEFPVFLKVCQEIAAKNRGRGVHVQPGLSVVRPGWYKSPETESSSNDEGGSP